jgi:hypothetical protein
MGNAYNILVGRPHGKRPLGRSRCRLEDYVELNLKKTLGGDISTHG